MSAPPTTTAELAQNTQDAIGPIIAFDNVSIAFEDNTVLDGISFQPPQPPPRITAPRTPTRATRPM